MRLLCIGLALGAWGRIAAGEFFATQTAYGSAADGNTVVVSWSDDADDPGEVEIRLDGIVLDTVPGVPGGAAYTVRNVPAGSHVFEASTPAGSLGSQAQTVITEAEKNQDVFRDASEVTCEQGEENGECEILIDWDNPAPIPSAFEVLVDGVLEASTGGFEVNAVIPGAAPGEHCVAIVATMTRPEGRYRGIPAESCCTITCGAPPCLAPQVSLVAQIAYGPGPSDGAAVLRWRLPAGEAYPGGIHTHVDGAAAATLAGSAVSTVITGLSATGHELGVEGDCGEANGLSTISRHRLHVRAETPHTSPIAGSVQCEWIPDDGGKTTATWEIGETSEAIDVYVEEDSVQTHVVTLRGESTSVTVAGTRPETVIVLQFYALHDGELHGSEPIRCGTAPALNAFLRGICNGAGSNPDISSAVFGLTYLYIGGTAPPCEAACRVNEDEAFDLSDMIYLLNYLFLGGPPPAGWTDGNGDDVRDPTCEALPASECATANEAACPR
jgi:hypothetical protein